MKITHLKLDDLYCALSNACCTFDGQEGCFAEESNMACPFSPEEGEGVEVRCGQIRPEHWREVFEGEDEQEPEPEPEMPFQFGDKVTVQLNSPCEGVFSAYLGDGMAYVLFDGETCCEEVAVCDLKAGWDD